LLLPRMAVLAPIKRFGWVVVPAGQAWISILRGVDSPLEPSVRFYLKQASA
jgi:hypothetical protein